MFYQFNFIVCFPNYVYENKMKEEIYLFNTVLYSQLL